MIRLARAGLCTLSRKMIAITMLALPVQHAKSLSPGLLHAETRAERAERALTADVTVYRRAALLWLCLPDTSSMFTTVHTIVVSPYPLLAVRHAAHAAT
ncbi:hypothetical protein BR93DRAFT_211464 [Coniochaeta sp. PMI_546]|nr:hypothetical protein BR93DRAFT_211464 [Coniochaeta sp. PMI_546]